GVLSAQFAMAQAYPRLLLGELPGQAFGEIDGAVLPPRAADGHGALEDARLRMNGRVVPMASPPLSFGEYHALLLSVRLGAADFLGGIGLLPPLVIDEPFVHMDSERVEATWALLSAVASERQVIVTTQDELRVKELGVKPDIHLQRND
ncbi:MAG TPA: hypothetical protein VK966_06920, partial [Longimicrobiales bacterium]|nr:hypothetical protein [Longimicrobiales bacterium]